MTQVKYGISQLDGTTEASPQNGTTPQAFHLQLDGTTETFPSPLDVTAPSQNGVPGTTEQLDTTPEDIYRHPSFWKDRPIDNCTSKFCCCSDFEKLGTVHCSDYDFYLYLNQSLDKTADTLVITKRLQGLRIRSLFVNDIYVELDEDSLEAVTFLETFEAERSGLQIIPDFSFVKDSIRIIQIEWSRLSSLNGTHLQNLTSVTHFSFSHNAIRHIHPDVFQGTENVEHLDLSYNLLTSIPSTLLDPMKHLNTFAASHNHLLHVKDVFAVTLPKVILLDFNYLTNPNDVLRFNVYKYHGTFQTEWDAKWNNYLRIWEVSRLDLSHNLISEMSLPHTPAHYYVISGVPLFRIDRVPLKPGEDQLPSSDKSKVTSDMRRCRVVEFRASRNRLKGLLHGDFTYLQDTVDLRLPDNGISWIDSAAFQPVRKSLQRLDLSCNSIRHLNGSLLNMYELKVLNVSYNAIQSFFPYEFSGLQALSELYLQHNQLTVLPSLYSLPVLLRVNISHNHIQLIRTHQLPTSLHIRRGEIVLGDNPFKCDCSLQPLTDWARGNYWGKNQDFVVTSPELCLRSDLGNRTWESEECPDKCTCSCRDDFMFVDCSSKSLFAVPQFLREDAVKGNKTVGSDVVMRQNRDPLRHFEDRVRGISLEYNNLESLEGARLPPNLTLLYLAHNKLRRLPESLLEDPLELKQVSLAGNPWRCDCSTVTFKKWLTSNKEIFQDLDAICCGPNEEGGVAGMVVWQLTYLDLCPSTSNRNIVSIVLGNLIFIIVCLCAKVLFRRYELNIRVFLYYHGFTFAREEDLDQDKVFDVFVSFSHADDEFVIKDIISVIERKDPEIRLCLHYRHFLAGELIQDNITWAVHSSKRTLLILTRNYLESEWCLQEFRNAHRQCMVDKVHRIVAVKVGELPKQIDPTLQMYLDCTTYLVWGEVNFWNKLLFVLPTRNAGKNKTFVGDYLDLQMTN